VSQPTVPALCLSCQVRLALCRGLCRLCYERLGRAVRQGKTTWVRLEEGGQALPAGRGGDVGGAGGGGAGAAGPDCGEDVAERVHAGAVTAGPAPWYHRGSRTMTRDELVRLTFFRLVERDLQLRHVPFNQAELWPSPCPRWCWQTGRT
jgi:hypothetical protein